MTSADGTPVDGPNIVASSPFSGLNQLVVDRVLIDYQNGHIAQGSDTYLNGVKIAHNGIELKRALPGNHIDLVAAPFSSVPSFLPTYDSSAWAGAAFDGNSSMNVTVSTLTPVGGVGTSGGSLSGLSNHGAGIFGKLVATFNEIAPGVIGHLSHASQAFPEAAKIATVGIFVLGATSWLTNNKRSPLPDFINKAVAPLTHG